MQLILDQDPLVLEETYLTADIAAASGTLTVGNIGGFAINKNLLINPWGENAEFVKTHTSTTPTGSTITLVANTTFPHYAGEKVYLVAYDKIELTHALTTAGDKTALTTSTGNGLVSLKADSKELIYSEQEYNSGYYFARYINSIGITWTVSGDTFTASAHGLANGETVKVIGATTLAAGLSTTKVYYVVQKDTNTFKLSLINGGTAITTTNGGTGTQTLYRSSLYGDPLVYSGWASNTVGYMIDHALRDLDLTLSDKITSNDCYEWINTGLRFIQGKLKRWPEYYIYNEILGQASRGTNIVAMPTDAYDRESNKSILGLRVGNNKNLSYLSPSEFEDALENVNVTQVTTEASATDTTLYINNSYDFDDTGSVNVYISGTKYSIEYTAITRSATAGALTVDSDQITVTIPADTYVWQGEEESKPSVFTVRNSQIEFYPLVDNEEDNANIYCDYSQVATSVDSDGDEIDSHRYDMVQDYLTWRIKCKAKKDGELDQKDAYYVSFKEKLNDAIRTLANNNTFKMKPKFNKMYYGG